MKMCTTKNKKTRHFKLKQMCNIHEGAVVSVTRSLDVAVI